MADHINIQQILLELSALERSLNDPATLRFLRSSAQENTIKTFGRKITNGWEEALDEALRGVRNISNNRRVYSHATDRGGIGQTQPILPGCYPLPAISPPNSTP